MSNLLNKYLKTSRNWQTLYSFLVCNLCARGNVQSFPQRSLRKNLWKINQKFRFFFSSEKVAIKQLISNDFSNALL